MTSLLLLLTFISQPFSALSDTTPKKTKTYAVSINKSAPSAYKGYLQGVNETALQLTHRPYPFGNANFDKTVSYNEIDKLTLHRTGGIGGQALVGGSVGALLGAIVGAITYKPCHNCLLKFDEGYNIAAGAAIGLLSGIGLGIVIGSCKHRFSINRNKENFDGMRSKLFRIYGDKENR
jgi:hypothetical protein